MGIPPVKSGKIKHSIKPLLQAKPKVDKHLTSAAVLGDGSTGNLKPYTTLLNDGFDPAPKAVDVERSAKG